MQAFQNDGRSASLLQYVYRSRAEMKILWNLSNCVIALVNSGKRTSSTKLINDGTFDSPCLVIFAEKIGDARLRHISVLLFHAK